MEMEGGNILLLTMRLQGEKDDESAHVTRYSPLMINWRQMRDRDVSGFRGRDPPDKHTEWVHSRSGTHAPRLQASDTSWTPVSA